MKFSRRQFLEMTAEASALVVLGSSAGHLPSK